MPRNLIPADLLVFPILLASLKRKNLPRLKESFILALAAFMASCLVSILITGHLQEGLWRWLKVAYLTTLAACFYLRANTKEDLLSLVKRFAQGTVITVVACVAAWAQFFLFHTTTSRLLTNHGSIPGSGFPRVCATFDYANLCCDYLLVGFCLVWLYHTQFPRRTGLIMLCALAWASFTTLSPELGGLTLAVAFLASHGKGSSLKWRLIRVIAGVLALLAAMGAVYGAKILYPPGWSTLGPPARLLCWEEAFHAWTAHPLFGWGGERAPITVNVPPFYFFDAHNLPLSILSQWGVFGLLAFSFVATYCLGVWPGQKQNFVFQVAIGCTLLYGGLFDSLEDARHLWILLGLSAACVQAQTQHRFVLKGSGQE